MRSPLPFGLVLLALLGPGLARADDPSKSRDTIPLKPVAKKTTTPPAFTPEREAAARAFIGRHHPELKALLDRLKPMNPTEYEKVVAELFQISENLATLQARDPRRYELDLEAWKARSRVELLAAQLNYNPSPEAESALRQALGTQLDRELAQRRFDREAAEARLKKLNDQIHRLEDGRASLLDARFHNLKKRGSAARPAAKGAPAPAPIGSSRTIIKGDRKP